MRSEVWRDTDKARTGMLPFVFEPGMSFERYVDYALAVPMYFVYRDGRYIDVAGSSFRDFLAGRLPQLPGEFPTEDDWSDHLTTLFPEVRMKRFLEMRGADGGRWRRICALPALWTGLLYDAHLARRGVGPRQGLERRGAAEPARRGAEDGTAHAVPPHHRARSWPGRCWQSPTRACSGAPSPMPRARTSASSWSRSRRSCATGSRLADEILLRYERDWGRRTDPLFTDYAF